MLRFAAFQWVWGLLFLLILFSVAVAMGSLAVEATAFKATARPARFFFGFALTPIVVGSWMMAISLLPSFFGKQYVVLLVPFMLSLWVLCRNRRCLRLFLGEATLLLGRARREAKHCYKSCNVKGTIEKWTPTIRRVLLLALYAGLALVAVFAVWYKFLHRPGSSWPHTFAIGYNLFLYALRLMERYLRLPTIILSMAALVFYIFWVKKGRPFFAFINSSFFSLAAMLMLGIFLMRITIYYVSPNMVAHDASQYLSEALRFSRTLHYTEISSYMGAPQGTIIGTTHNFLWPAYISFGTICTEYGNMGVTTGLAALLALRMSVVFMFAGLLAVAMLLPARRTTCLLVLALAFLAPNFASIICNYSRDGFRVTALLLLLCLLCMFSAGGCRYSLSFYIFAFFTGFFIASGHPINLIIGVCIGLPWLVLELAHAKGFKHLFPLVGCLFAGFVASIYNILYAYIRTGSSDGNVFQDALFAGTAMETAYLQHFTQSVARGSGLLWKTYAIFADDTFLLYPISLLLTAWAVVLLFRKRYKAGMAEKIVLFVNLSLFAGIYLFNFITWGRFTYMEWMVRNHRYSWHLYFFAALAVAASLRVLAGYYGIAQKSRLLGVVQALVVTVGVLTAAATAKDCMLRIRSLNRYCVGTAGVLRQCIELAQPGRALTTSSRLTYIFNNTLISGETFYCRDLIAAQSFLQVENFLQEKQITVVFFDKVDSQLWWTESILYDYLRTSTRFSRAENDRALVFFLEA